MIFYHGSPIAGITELGKSSAKLNEGKSKLVYITPNRAYALFYIRDPEINYVTCGVTSEGYIRYDERFPGQIRTLYQGKSGYLYRCAQSRDFEKTDTQDIWVSKRTVTIESVEFIPDVFEEILKYEAAGEIKVVLYETLTDEKKHEIFDMTVNSIFRFDRVNERSKKSLFYRDNFPDAWNYAINHPEEKQARIDEWNKRCKR